MEDENSINPKNYTCGNCGSLKVAPKHCGRSMLVENLDDGSYWICWKGKHAPCCGRPSLDKIEDCCNDISLSSKVDESKILL